MSSLYDDPYEQFSVGELTVKIVRDPHPSNPRTEHDNVGTMVCWHSRYELGDEHMNSHSIRPAEYMRRLAFKIHPELEDYFENRLFTQMVDSKMSGVSYGSKTHLALVDAYDERMQEIVDKVLAKHYVVLPLFLYDHGGITMSTGSFGDPWDSGQVGFIYCDREKIMDEWGKYYPNETWKQLQERAANYLKGEVEEYDKYLTGDVYGFVVEDEDGDHLESVWGFFGEKYAVEEGKSAAEHEWNSILEERRKAEETERHAQEWEQRMMAL